MKLEYSAFNDFYIQKETKSWERFKESIFLHLENVLKKVYFYMFYFKHWHTFGMIVQIRMHQLSVSFLVSIITNPTSKVYEISEFWYVGLKKFPGTIV